MRFTCNLNICQVYYSKMLIKSLSPILTNYFINNHNLKMENNILTLEQSTFIPHINNIDCKTIKVLNFWTVQMVSIYQLKSSVYLALFDHPYIEYACTIWDPKYKIHYVTIKRYKEELLARHLETMTSHHSSVTAML